jgi:hypothetical protein
MSDIARVPSPGVSAWHGTYEPTVQTAASESASTRPPASGLLQPLSAFGGHPNRAAAETGKRRMLGLPWMKASTSTVNAQTPGITAGGLGSEETQSAQPGKPQSIPGSSSALSGSGLPMRRPETIVLGDNAYSIEYSQRSGEAGRSVQLKATLKHGDESIPVRIKVLDRSNEALAYQQMLGKNDAMAKFLPHCYGTVDSAGNPLEFTQPGKIAAPAFLVLRDEVSAVESESSRVVNRGDLRVKDFKLSDKALRSDRIERKINGFPEKSRAYYATKDVLMNLSRGPFVTHEGGHLDKIRQMARTNQAVDGMFNSVTDKSKLLSELKVLRDAMQKSDFAFVDSSLLFIPVEDRSGNVSISMKFIDPAHSFHKSAAHPDFSLKKDAAVKSVDWLIDRAQKSILEGLASSAST